MTSSESKERLEILEMIQQGKISPEDGLKLINALQESQEQEEQEYLQAREEMLYPPVEGQEPLESPEIQEPGIDQDEMDSWRRWWVIPFWIGVGITVLGGSLMYWAWAAHGIGLGFIAAWIPFLIGLGIMVLGWNSRSGPWIHIRVHQKTGASPERITISLPLPVRFFAWTIRTFGRWIPDIPGGVDEVILALSRYAPGDAPLSINVDDEEEGQKVIIYIG
jgi:hypothetical protein